MCYTVYINAEKWAVKGGQQITYQVFDLRRETQSNSKSTDVCFVIADSSFENTSLAILPACEISILLSTNKVKGEILRNVDAVCYLPENKINKFIQEFSEIQNRENSISLCLHDIKVLLNLISAKPSEIHFYTDLPNTKIKFISGIVMLKGCTYKDEWFNRTIKQIDSLFDKIGDYAYALKEPGINSASCFFVK